MMIGAHYSSGRFPSGSPTAPKKTRLRIVVMPTPRQLLILGTGITWSLAVGVHHANAQGDEAQALRSVRGEIGALEERLAAQQAERETEWLVLKEAELRAAGAARALRDIREQLAEQSARQQVLLEDSRVANSRLDSERGALAQQLRTSYVTGRQEMLKLLLNQQNPARLGRMVIYYDYLNRARSLRLEVVESELEVLTQLTAESVDVGLELARLGRTQATELSALESSRDDRRAALEVLEQDITTSGEEIRRLRDEAQRLGELVADLGNSQGLFPPETAGGFSAVAGELAWPVAGSLDSDFGQPRAGGQLRWSGVVMSAPAGTPVRAVYYGRVVYADWLPGLGLLIIIEHGSGYMSLYGHNEALLKESGDRVVPGEVIAHVGDSGGQTQTALYFEIRRDGEPIDPHPWMAQEPGATR